MKRKILTILLVALMIMGSMPVFPDEQVDSGYVEAKTLFPQANILSNIVNPFEKEVVSTNARSGEVVTEFKYDFLKGVEPIHVYERADETGIHTLNVYEDGSYELLSLTNEVTPMGVTGWVVDRTDSTYKYYDDVKVKYTTGGYSCQYYIDVKYNIGNSRYYVTGNPYSASATMPYAPATGDKGYSNGTLTTTAYHSFSYTTYYENGVDENNNPIYNVYVYYYDLGFKVATGSASTPTLSWTSAN